MSIQWEAAMVRKIPWPKLWKAMLHHFSSSSDRLRCTTKPSNLFTLSKVETLACPLCQGRGTLQRIITCCPKALGDRCYGWHDDQALKEAAGATCHEQHRAPPASKEIHHICQRRRAASATVPKDLTNRDPPYTPYSNTGK